MNASSSLKINDLVRVRDPQTIAATLDADGCLDGMPWMPGMTRFCGRHFRISQPVSKACVMQQDITIRGLSDVLSLDMPRCDGHGVGDCQMECHYLWKPQWLQRVDKESGEPADQPLPNPVDTPLYQQTAPAAQTGYGHFRCQATQLGKISHRLPIWNFGQYIDDVGRRGVSPGEVLEFAWKKLTRSQGTRPITGACKVTPVSSEVIEIGQSVRVRSLAEITATLDAAGCNRGLWFDPEMSSYCDREYKITRRIDRLIDERTGALIELAHANYVLDDLACSGLLRRFCGRKMLHFWRAVWLRPVAG